MRPLSRTVHLPVVFSFHMIIPVVILLGVPNSNQKDIIHSDEYYSLYVTTAPSIDPEGEAPSKTIVL